MRAVFHITPDSNRAERCWDKFPELAAWLVLECGATVYVVGTPGEIADDFMAKTEAIRGSVIDLSGQTTLTDLVSIVRDCDLLVCINSFVMHLGVTLGVKMFAIVGATDPKVILPPGVPHAYSLYAKDIPLETVMEGIR